jgi:hypothetical protein
MWQDCSFGLTAKNRAAWLIGKFTALSKIYEGAELYDQMRSLAEREFLAHEKQTRDQAR